MPRLLHTLQSSFLSHLLLRYFLAVMQLMDKVLGKSATGLKPAESMDDLILSFQEQTLKLKVRLTQQHLSKSSRSPEVSAPKDSKSLIKTPPAPVMSRPCAASPGAEFHYSKTLIENLLRDNSAFHDEVDDYREALRLVVQRCKSAQLELEQERARSHTLQCLETQLQATRQKTQQALDEASRLRERYLEMMEVARQGAFEVEEEGKEAAVVADYLRRENQHLREMLGIGRLSDSKSAEIDAALRKEEESLENCQDTAAAKLYRQERIQRKAAAQAKPIRSSFLFAPEKQQLAGSSGVETFFKSKEAKATPSADQMEEPK